MLSYKPIDDLTFNAMYSVLRGGMKLRGDLEKFLAPFGLSQGRFAIMLSMADRNGTDHTPSHLAEVTGKSRPTVTKMLDKLDADGLIFREKSGEDGRGRKLALTRKGEELLNKIIPGYNSRILEMSFHLSEEDKKQLISIIGKISIL